MGAQRVCTVSMPLQFRRQDVLHFHGRDPQGLSERIGATFLQKGLMWQGLPACLNVDFCGTDVSACLHVDGVFAPGADDAFEAMLRRVLGMTDEVLAFEARFRDHPQLGEWIARQPGLSVPATATPFEAIAWAITGQQISVKAAVSIRRNLISSAGPRHSSGLLCFPDAGAVVAKGYANLRQCGFTETKAGALLTLAENVLSGHLPLDAWLDDLPEPIFRERLQAIKGIGSWTINYALLRGYGRLDGLLHGDAAARRGMQRLLNSTEKIGEDEAKRWLSQFSPWSALAVAHIWAHESLTA